MDSNPSPNNQPNQPLDPQARPTQPTPLVADTPSSDPVSPVPEMVKKRSKKPLIALIIAIIITILGVGTALAYNVWYQNPDKVVSDSLLNAMKAKTMNFTAYSSFDSDTVDGTLTMDGGLASSVGKLNIQAKVSQGGKSYEVAGSGLLDNKSDLYVKAQKIDALAKDARDALPQPEQRRLFDQIIAKINDKWIKISSKDLKETDATVAKRKECTENVAKKLSEDKAITAEIGEVYKNNRFIIIKEKLGSKDGSLGYLLDLDMAKMKAFVGGLKGTQLYKMLHECDKTFELDADAITTEKTDAVTRLELWVSRFDHQITKVVTEMKNTKTSDKLSATFAPRFNEEVTVTTPSESTTFEQLTKDIQALMQSTLMITPEANTFSDATL